ncbi:MAG: DUF924 domain-containing protein [Gammaproteobacteria bacterium]|nr:DUF924 domain-containing protein [Gammaproteobacteria bacterium]
MTADDPAERVLRFWYGDLDNGLMDPARRQGLFRSDPGFDARIRDAFGADVEAALAGRRDDWSTTVRGRAALLLLLDQFTRNIFRGTARAFAGDPQALAFAREGVSRGDDRLLDLEERVFFYLPFEHSESLADQETSLTLFENLLSEQEPDSPAAEVVGNYLQHARDHHTLIERFGRFPHRNRILDRPPTAEEAAWLGQDGRSFGQ